MEIDVKNRNYDALRALREGKKFTSDAFFALQETSSYIEDDDLKRKTEQIRNTLRDVLNKVVEVSEVLTAKVLIPGGHIEDNKSEAKAA